MWISNANSNCLSSLYTKSYLEAKLNFCKATCFKSQTQYVEATLVFILKWKKVKVLNMQKPAPLPGLFWKAGL